MTDYRCLECGDVYEKYFESCPACGGAVREKDVAEAAADFPPDAPDKTQKNINESEDKLRLETSIKRGSGTRDQDQIKVKVRGNDPDEAVSKMNRTLELLQETAEQARATQPDNADSE